jgi:hypothetical protein
LKKDPQASLAPPPVARNLGSFFSSSLNISFFIDRFLFTVTPPLLSIFGFTKNTPTKKHWQLHAYFKKHECLLVPAAEKAN